MVASVTPLTTHLLMNHATSTCLLPRWCAQSLVSMKKGRCTEAMQHSTRSCLSEKCATQRCSSRGQGRGDVTRMRTWPTDTEASIRPYSWRCMSKS